MREIGLQNTQPANGMHPSFSIIIPTFQRNHLLKRAVESVLAQNFEDFELIIVDDGSSDNTRQAVKSYRDSRIQYVSREHGGISAARNTGLSVSRGKWVTFLDDDDEALPDWLLTFHKLVQHSDLG